MKTFILNTNVLPHDSDAVFSFHDDEALISMTVVEELSLFKKFNDEKIASARLISKSVDLSLEIL
ncbi:MAG: hypothetical protein LE180_04410 [Endomicrobium sp.]|uniref:PIN domain-containing protein n=1 Tax=Candidatus Endomicrobiellum pyrsonymphae TaxID=1408203 RepID=UPI003576A8D2|nr:hypothetical protein [Endomicrobium sp.]